MLKRFFISMLGTMAGLWLSLIILGIGVFVFFGILIANVSGKEPISRQNALYVEFVGDMPERENDFTFDKVFDLNSDEVQNLSDILSSIRMAAYDKSISGIYIDCKGSTLGVASRSEIIEALRDFKKSGKWVYAYADNYDQGDYYISTVADKVYLNPVGAVNVHGLAATTIFFKTLMEKLGVEMQVVKVGEFKSAVEPYLRTDMSEPSKLQTSIFLNQIWGDIVGTISENRGVDAAAVNLWADSLCMTWRQDEYLNRKIVDELKYRSEVEDIIREKMNVSFDKKLPLVTPLKYMADKNLKNFNKEKKHIAVYYAVGEIVDEGIDGIIGEEVVPDILALAKDNNVKGLVLRVNSGGGSAFASEQIWHALEDFKKTGKPFYVSMGDYAASGGYYISCGADKIYADASTLTGSIGIFGMIPNAEKLLTDKIGLNFESVETNANASFPALYKAATPSQLSKMQMYVERGYDTFTARVSQGRNIPVDSVKAIGGGRVWDGSSALSLGLVDEIGSLNSALTAMAEELKMDAEDYVCYPPKKDILMDLLFGKDAKVNVNIGNKDIKTLRDYLYIVKKIKTLAPLQARMEHITLN